MSVKIVGLSIQTDLEVDIPKWYLHENRNYIEETKRLFEQMGYKFLKQKKGGKFITLVFRRE